MSVTFPWSVSIVVTNIQRRSWKQWRADSASKQPMLLPAGIISIPPPKLPHGLVGMLPSPNAIHVANSSMESRSKRVLWDAFEERVEPLVRIMFRWQISDLVTQTIRADSMPLSEPERALVDAIYYASANSMTNDQCIMLLQTPKIDLLAECQTRCEQSLLGPDLFCVRDIATIKAVIFYIVSYPSD